MAFGFSGRRSGQLPGQVTSFVGRQSELADVLGVLGRSRLVTLTGPGGVGKTRLALHAARKADEGFTDGVCLVELSGLKDAELLPHTVASALDLPEQNTRPQMDVVVEHLAERELLLILDTCEHVLDACALLADLLLPEAPGLTLLATSRQPLDVPGEHVLSVPPLPLPPEEEATGRKDGAPAGHDGDALTLFAERAAAVVPGFALTPANRGPALTLCRRLDGIPLAIELAAVRLRALPLEELVQRLGDTFALLAGGRLTTLSRHQTLRTAIGWSHELCTASERLLWARLSVFSGTFDLPAAERVCADSRLPVGEVVRTLIGLVDKSVVLRAEHDEDGARYRLLDTLREYGAEWLESIGETAVCRRRLIEHCHSRLRHFEDHFATDQQLPLYRALATDRDNLRTALEYALEAASCRQQQPVPPAPPDGARGARSGDPYEHTSPALALSASMWTYFACGGRLVEARYWMDKALAAPAPSTAQSSTDRAKTLTWYGLFSIMAGSHESSLEPLREAHALARRLDDPLLTAWAVGFEGSALNYRGEHDRALSMTDEAVALMRSTGDQLTFLMASYAKGFAYALAGRPDEAVTACEEGLRLLGEASEERWNQGYLYAVKGFGHILRGEREECAAAALRALRLKGDLGDVIGVAYCLSLLAWVASAQSRHRRAALLLGAATEQWRISGDSTFGGITSLQFLSEAVSSDVRGTLGPERYDRAHRQGAQLSLQQAILFAADDAESLHALPRQAGTGRTGSAPERGEGTEALTRREREVAALVAEGLSNREIAERLVVSKRTADAHIEHILAKLGFSSRAQITALLGSEAPGPTPPRTTPPLRRT